MSSNTNIGNTPVNQGYVQLIHTGETGGIDGTLRTLYDGDGTASDLQIASNKVKVSTELYIGSKTATEFIQDIVGDMFTTGSYTNITTTYDDTNGNIDLSASGEVTLTGTQTLTNKTLASPTFTGTANGVNLTLSGDLTVNGTTTTLDTTNLKVTDNLIELNQGVASNANDSGIIIERGSTGDNAIFMWDESADKFTLGTTTATADATGNITITTGTLVASTFEGNLTGNVTGSASLNLLISNNLSDLANAATARSNLGVDAAGTDNSTDVTLAGTLDYITLSGQQITRNAIDLTTDVTGTLPVGNGGTGLTSISTLLNSNVTPTSLGLVIGTDVQAQDTLLQDIADFSLSNPSQDGYLIAYSDAEPQLELVAPGISFNGSTANGLLTYGNSTTADVESNLTFDGSHLSIAPTGRLYLDGGGNTYIFEESADNVIHYVGGQNKLRFNSTGAIFNDAGLALDFRVEGDTDPNLFFVDGSTDRVGIKTNSPGRDLEVAGNGIIRLNNASSDTGIDFNSSDMQIRYRGASDLLQIYSYGTSSNIVTIKKSDGNFGIGVSSPQNKLHVDATTTSNVVARFNTDSTFTFIDLYNDDLNRVQIGNADDGDFIIRTNDAERFRVDKTTGNIGIGVTSPGAAIEVKDYFQIEASSTYMGILGFNRNVNTGAILNGSYGAYQLHNYQGKLHLQVYNSSGTAVDQNALVIDNSANVGIGVVPKTGGSTWQHIQFGGTGNLIARKSDTTVDSMFSNNYYVNSSNVDSYIATGAAARMFFNDNVITFDQAASGSADAAVSFTTAMKIDALGDVKITESLGIGVNASSTTGRLDCSNDVVAYSTSDKRLKENIKPLDSALDKVLHINGVEFDWKELTEEEKKTIHGNEGHDVGIIAQEIEEVLPEVVTTRDSGYKAVKYEKIVPLLIEAIKELKTEIEELKNG